MAKSPDLHHFGTPKCARRHVSGSPIERILDGDFPTTDDRARGTALSGAVVSISDQFSCITLVEIIHKPSKSCNFQT
jgi:hypothetical protein